MLKTPGYYALPLQSLPGDVYRNFNEMTLLSRPNERVVQLANDIIRNHHTSISPTKNVYQRRDISQVRTIFQNILIILQRTQLELVRVKH